MIAFLADCAHLLLDWVRMAALAAVLGVILVWDVVFTAEGVRRCMGFASWREIGRGQGFLVEKGDPGLLRLIGCALGAARRHILSPWHVLRIPWGQAAFLGEPELVNSALRAAIRDWDGALVYVDAAGGSAGLEQDSAVRISPGRLEGCSYNPMLAIRGGSHAWSDARILASALLQSTDAWAVQALAALILDQLYTAAPEGRTLPALRMRLLEGADHLARLAARVHVQENGEWRPHPEIRRAALALRAEPSRTQAALQAARKALQPFGDARLLRASGCHQLDLADLGAGKGPKALFVEVPPTDAQMAPYCAAIIAQLVSACTDARHTDHRGRPKRRGVLLVVDDAAAMGFVPLLRRRASIVAESGLYLCVGARSANDLPALFCTANEAEAYEPPLFDSLVALGPQEPETATELSRSAGSYSWFEYVWPGSWRDLICPQFKGLERPFISENVLKGFGEKDALILMGCRRPIWGRGLLRAYGCPSKMIAPTALPEAAMDWNSAAPPHQPEPEPVAELVPPHEQSAARARKRPDAATVQTELTLIHPDQENYSVPKSAALRRALSSRPERTRKF